MSLTILSNVAASQRIIDLLNYTNQKNISLAQVDFNSLTALAQAHHDAFGRNTTLNVVAVNNRGYINAAPHASGVVVKYQRNEIGENAYTPKMAYDITQTTTWDQLTYAVSQELNVPYEECSNYTQHKLNEPGTAYVAPHTKSNKLSVVIGTQGGYLGNGNNITLISNSLLLLPSAVVVVCRLV